MEEGKRLVYVCEGGDCSEKGSIDLHGELKTILADKDPDGKNKLRRYPCFGGCEHGINVVLFPDRVFYSKVKKSDLPAVVEHLCDGGPVVERLTGHVPKDVETITWALLDTGF